MSEPEDHPTWTRNLRPKPQRWEAIKGFLQALSAAGAVAVAVVTFVWSSIGRLATDEEVGTHNLDHLAHAPLRERIESLETRYGALSDRVYKADSATIALGARIVSLVAADRESRRELRADAATFYREEYMRLIHRGTAVEDAVVEALRAPWLARPER